MDCMFTQGSAGRRMTMCAIGFTVVSTTLCTIVFLAIFGLANPEAHTWYGKLEEKDDQGGHTLFLSRKLAMEAEATDIVDIHSRFVNWNLWGFVMAFAPLPIAWIVLISHCIHI